MALNLLKVPEINDESATAVDMATTMDESWGEEGEGAGIQKHRDFAQPDERFGGAPALMEMKWQERAMTLLTHSVVG